MRLEDLEKKERLTVYEVTEYYRLKYGIEIARHTIHNWIDSSTLGVRAERLTQRGKIFILRETLPEMKDLSLPV